ncbi:MAG: hypothetical protein ABJH68_21865 [Ilumatobacter sp.]|uniref:hypothetical protein n=1 Tax=Ilumatobacter sp. TaxID=1967498 RepID=UPI003296EA7D
MSDTPPPFPQQPAPPAYPSYGGPAQGAPPPGAPFTPAPGFPTPGSAQPKADIRPRARWFWIGGLVMVLGVVLAIVLGVFGVIGISDTVDDFARVSPGTDEVRIDSAGDYVIYAEDGSFFADVQVLSPDGEPVTTSRYSTELTYDLGGRNGQAVSTFEAPSSGTYTVTTDTRIAIGPSVAGELVRAILIPFIVTGLGILLGLIVIIVTAVKRSNSKKRAAAAH